MCSSCDEVRQWKIIIVILKSCSVGWGADGYAFSLFILVFDKKNLFSIIKKNITH